MASLPFSRNAICWGPILLLLFSLNFAQAEEEGKSVEGTGNGSSENALPSPPEEVGMDFRPHSPYDPIDGSLIWFQHGGVNGSWRNFSKLLDEFTGPYEEQNRERYDYAFDCDHFDMLPTKRVCIFDLAKLGDKCSKREKYGYYDGQPCVAIKLNRILDWVPKPYTKEEMEQKGVPKEVVDVYDNSSIYITCEGENPADQENMGKLDYYPDQRIKSEFFPFTNLPGYETPFVFVRFGEIRKGILVNIKCRAWAANIDHDLMERSGTVHFELLVD